MSATSVGESVGSYRIVGVLGRGGMGEVFKGEHVRLHRLVALKALPADLVLDPERRERLLREARTASALNHPHIVTVHDFVTEGGHDFIVMELVEGGTLGDRLGNGPLETGDAIRYAAQIADALAAAHAVGIVHRDLKPANVMVNERDQVKLMDFGLARVQEDGESDAVGVPLTRLGTVLGTLLYMSPEQARGKLAGPPSDVFSFGILLYEMLSGRRPFQGRDRIETLHQVCNMQPTPLEELCPDLPSGLAEIVRGALAKAPGDRPTSAAVAASLKALKAGDQLATGAGAVGPQVPAVGASRPRAAARKRATRRRVAISAAVVAAVVLLTLLAIRTGRVTDGADHNGPTAAQTPYALTEAGFRQLDRFDLQGNLDRAIASFQSALGLDEDFAAAYAGLAWTYVLRHREVADPQLLELAVENGQTAVKLNPDLAVAHAYLGAALAERGDREAAHREFEEALAADPTNPVAHRELGMLWMSEGELGKAAEAVRAAVDREPDDWFHHLILGLVLYEAARYDDAEGEFLRSSQLAPDSYQPYRNLAAVYQKQGRYDEAAAALQESLKHRPVASVYSNLGNLYYFQGLYQKAVTAFEKSVDLGPNSHLRWSNLGDAYRRIPGDESKAVEAFERALQLLRPEIEQAPGDSTLRSRLALLLAKSGRADEALAEAAKTEALGGESPSVLYRLLQAYELAGDRQRALGMLERALAAGYPLDEIRREPELSDLRQDSRFHRILVKWD